MRNVDLDTRPHPHFSCGMASVGYAPHGHPAEEWVLLEKHEDGKPV